MLLPPLRMRASIPESERYDSVRLPRFGIGNQWMFTRASRTASVQSCERQSYGSGRPGSCSTRIDIPNRLATDPSYAAFTTTQLYPG